MNKRPFLHLCIVSALFCNAATAKCRAVFWLPGHFGSFSSSVFIKPRIIVFKNQLFISPFLSSHP